MAKNNDAELSRWVDERLKPLDGAVEFHPDLRRGLGLLRESRDAAHARTRTWMWTAGMAIVTSICALAFPVTRVFASRCVGVCVAETSEIRALLWSAFSSPGDSVTTLNKLTGKMAPDFSSTDSSGAGLRLSDFGGKVVVLNFWATWCPPCAQEVPWFVEFQRKYGAAGLVVVGASLDDDGWKSVRPFMGEMGVNYRMIIADRRIARLYGGVDSLPATVIIDRAGRVAATHVGLIGHDDFETGIQALLNGGREVSAVRPD